MAGYLPLSGGEGGSGGGVESVNAGTNITVTGTAANPVINATGSGGGVESVNAGTNVTITGTAADPVVNATIPSGFVITPLTEEPYFDFNNNAWSSVITDNASGDIAYFSQSGAGDKFTNLPVSIVLNAANSYRIDSEVTESNGFAQRLSIASSDPTDDMNNRTLQRAGENFAAGKSQWAEVTLKRDAVVYDDKTVALPKVFKTISTGSGLTGEVVDDVLTLNTLSTGAFSFTTSFYSEAVQTTPINRAIYVTDETHFRNSLMLYDASINGVCLESGAEGNSLHIAVCGVFATGDLSLTDINPGDLIYIDNVKGILNWYALVEPGSHPCGWYAGSGKMWIDIDMYNRYRSAYGFARLNDDVAFESVTTNSVTGTAVGRTVIQNAGIVKRNNSTDSNSIAFDAGTMNYRSDSHVYKTNSGKLLFEFNNATFNVFDKPIVNLKAATTDNEAVNLGQVKEVSNSITQARMVFTGGTLYAHNNDHNMFINYVGTGKEIGLDTMRAGTDQQSDSTIIYNDGTTSVTVRLFYESESVAVIVPTGYTLRGFANRVIGQWVHYLVAGLNSYVTQSELEAEVRQELAYELPTAINAEFASRLVSKHVTISDNITISVPLAPVEEIVTVLYSIQNSDANEKGRINIIETDSGYGVDVITHAVQGKESAITFGAHAENGSLLLDVIGSGSGLLTDLKYRVNTFNNLEV